MQINFTTTHPDAKMPTYGHSGDAGMDLYTTEAKVLAPGERYSAPTGIAMAIPDGYVGLIWEKSGLAFRHGIKTIGGVIDATYRGQIKVGLLNTSDQPHEIAVGDKVAQIIIQKFEVANLVQVDSLDDTTRGQDGFGSTGK